MNKFYFLIILLLSLQSVFAQKQKEIKDFKERWKLEVPDMVHLDINNLAGNLKIIGTEDSEFSIRAQGQNVDQLFGGFTGLGFLFTKDKKGNYRIQGLIDPVQKFEGIYTIQLPKKVSLNIHFGSRVQDSTYWMVEGMEGTLAISKLRGKLSLKQVSGPLSISNQLGDVEIQYKEIDQNLPHSIAALGKISLALPWDTGHTLDLNLIKQTNLDTNQALEGSPPLKEGTNLIKKGTYEYKIQEGGVQLKIHSFSDFIHLQFY